MKEFANEARNTSLLSFPAPYICQIHGSMKEVAKYLYDVYFGNNDIKDIHIKGQRYAVTCTIRMNDTTSTEEDENSKESVNEQEIE